MPDNKDETKKKNIVYPKHWEEDLFENYIKRKVYAGSWQSFIREAIRKHLIDSGIEQKDL